jgi:hypothetical protein
MDRQQDDRSLGDLFAELSHEMSTLVRQEVTLAKTELSQKAATAGRNVGFLAVGGAVAYAGFLALLAAAAIILALFLPLWLAALIVGVIVTAVGAALVQKGLSTLRQMELVPKETVQTLKEDKVWAKKEIKQ